MGVVFFLLIFVILFLVELVITADYVVLTQVVSLYPSLMSLLLSLVIVPPTVDLLSMRVVLRRGGVLIVLLIND